MYFPIGWPKVLNIFQPEKVCSIKCNKEKILFAILTENAISIWYCHPCLPIAYHRRSQDCVNKYGRNLIVEWHPDSKMLLIATNDGYLLFYYILGNKTGTKMLYDLKDSPINGLQRDSAELFIKESIPTISLKFDKSVWVDGGISSLTIINDEFMLCTKTNFVIRYKWNGKQNRDYSLDLRRIPFSNDQQISTLAIPLTNNNMFISKIEYSELLQGFAVVFNCGRAGFLTAKSLKFDPNQVQGVWARNLKDATCVAVNHVYKLVAFGKNNSQTFIYYVDETKGSLEISHTLSLSTKDYPGIPGPVSSIKWTPDNCAIALAWCKGGISIWSTFGTLLLCTLKWDYGIHLDSFHHSQFNIKFMEWSAEGYQLWMLKESLLNGNFSNNESCQFHSVIRWDFVKSALTVNPCMSRYGHIYLQGKDRLYINLEHKISLKNMKIYFNNGEEANQLTHILSGSKQWLVVPIPSIYTSCNWPIRFTAIDEEGQSLAVAGKNGLAYYSLLSKKWQMFGNEYQEKDFIVTGGLLWYKGYLITSSYSTLERQYEIRVYPKNVRLDNIFVKSIIVISKILLINVLNSFLLTFCADKKIRIYNICSNEIDYCTEISFIHTIDTSYLTSSSSCIVNSSLMGIKADKKSGKIHCYIVLLNISGKVFMIQYNKPSKNNSLLTNINPIALASSVEIIWIPWNYNKEILHLTESVWLFCGNQGMKVWLPVFPKSSQGEITSYLSQKIILQFNMRIYPLAFLFEDAVFLGIENDTLLYSLDTSSPFILPFSVLQLTSQVYLQHILRQLIYRKLGYHAWEIAKSYISLPYFSHSLELLLHEVLEEEAISKKPFPDAQLPSVVAFIKEFPSFWGRAIVQCARKTEISLWPYLFSIVGPPQKLLQFCLNNEDLDTAAGYLLILQNLEASTTSKKYAISLLDVALKKKKWSLSRDLVRFLKTIDPTDDNLLKNFLIQNDFQIFL